MSENKRYFYVTYHADNGSFGGYTFISRNSNGFAPYVNMLKAKKDIMSNVKCSDLVINNIIELTEADYMDFIEGLDVNS